MDIQNHPIRVLRIAMFFVVTGGSTVGASWSESNMGLAGRHSWCEISDR